MNVANIHPSSLSCSEQTLRELKKKVTQVAVEIEYGGRNVFGDTPIFARELDRRKIKPLTRSSSGTGHGQWFHKHYRAQRLVNFLTSHMPDLYEHGYTAVLESVESKPHEPLPVIPVRLFPKAAARAAQGIPDVTREPVIQPEVIQSPVIHERLDSAAGLDSITESKAMNVDGWTVRADQNGKYRAFKKVDGKTRCIYIGRDPDQAGEKIAAWTAKHKVLESAK